MVTGIAWAAQDAGSTVNVVAGREPDDDPARRRCRGVVLSRANGQLQIVTATPNTGFTAEVEVAAGREVEADFRGNGERVQFNAELEDGVVRVRIRERSCLRSDIEHRSRPRTRRQTSYDRGRHRPRNRLDLDDAARPAPSTDPEHWSWPTGKSSDVPVADAGSVLLRRSGGSLTILSTQANPGWVVEVEVGTGREVEGDFRNGGRRVKFNFELEDGVIRIRIESEGSTSDDSAPAPPARPVPPARPLPRAPTGTTNRPLPDRRFRLEASPTTWTAPEP